VRQPNHAGALLVESAALLAGLGGAIDRIQSLAIPSKAPLARTGDGRAAPRTCVEAGSSLMFTVCAPGARGLRFLSQTETTSPDTIGWLRAHLEPGRVPEIWRTESFVGEPPQAWRRALEAATSVGAEDVLRRAHAVLGPRGRIFSVSRLLGPADGAGASVTWQLDRSRSPIDALEALGWGTAWPTAVEPLRALFGMLPTVRSGPWSLLLPLYGDDPAPARLRIGTACWARHVEDDAKRRRLAAVVDRLGGDAGFAEALYKVLHADARGRSARVGRAVEIEVDRDGLRAVEFYLSAGSA
jgi:hypothetical protein